MNYDSYASLANALGAVGLTGQQARPHQLEVDAVGALAEAQRPRAVLHVGNALHGHRVRAQVRRRRAFVQARTRLQAGLRLIQ